MEKKLDVHQAITDQIITAIEAGAGDWQMPWHRSGEGLNRPVNIDTGNHYRGVNVIALWCSAQMRGFSSGTWGTYRQWQNRDCQVRKGEKASLIVFYKELDIQRSTDSGETEADTVLFARASWVFNADQVDGYTPEEAITPPISKVDALDAADRFIRATQAEVRHGGTRAYYRPSEDYIQMPDKERFVGSATSSPTESYYATLLHELTHYAAFRIMPRRSSILGTGAQRQRGMSA